MYIIPRTNNLKTNRPCGSCGTHLNSLSSFKNGPFFLHMPIRYQIDIILHSPGITTFITNRNRESVIQENNIKDIFCGQLQKDMLERSTLGPNDLSLLCNTDNVSVFNHQIILLANVGNYKRTAPLPPKKEYFNGRSYSVVWR